MFRPWVGEKYDQGIGGRKVLLVAESCYEWEDTNGKMTPKRDHMTTQIQWILTGETMPFYSNIAHTFTRAAAGLSSIADFWQRVAFHEFVQRPMTNASERPSSSDWERGQKPFLEVAQKLSPDCVFILGFELWKWLPELEGYEAEKLFCSEGEELWRCGYRFQSERVTPVYRLHHPSRAFSPELWAPCVRKALESG